MSMFRSAAVAALCGAFLAGCWGADPYRRFHLGPARDVVAGSVQAIGGLKAWQGVDEIETVAVATWYDQTGRATSDRQLCEFDIHGGTVTAEGATPRGAWRAVVNDEGKLHGGDGLEATIVGQQRTVETLATLLHRVRGPLNLLGRRERVHAADPVRIDGIDLIRVGVTGDNRRAIAYYFDRATSVLRMVTCGADTPGREGTVTLFQYKMQPNGMAFPSRIRIVKIGEHVLVGEKTVLEVGFSDVEID